MNNKIGFEIPLNAIGISLIITVLLALVNIGSNTAFNSVVSLQISCLFISYFISVSCVLIRRITNQPLPPSRWSMGRLAIPVNILALMYIAFVFVMTLFPLAVPVVPKTMNWAALIWGVIVGFAVVNYLVHGRKVYKGPVVQVSKEY